MGLFDELDALTGHIDHDPSEIVKVPFGWPGGKSKSLGKILPHLPYRNAYVEPFGGSFAIGLARQPSKLDVFNDRYGGVCSFFRVIRDPILFEQLCQRLDLTVHSREEFEWCKSTWKNVQDDVERAARWYYMIIYSFANLGRCFGRALTGGTSLAGKIQSKLKSFAPIRDRMIKVQIENQDWYDCMKDYDTPETVFYIDPPYIDASTGIYEYALDEDTYRKLITFIFNCQGFCALSGYAGNPIFDNNPWDEIYTWDAFVSIESIGQNVGNKKLKLKDITERSYSKECLWIKEVR